MSQPHTGCSLVVARGSRRDRADVLRTRYWFHGLALRTGTWKPYMLEKIFEGPEAFGKSENGDRYHKNKWSGYRDGKHVPLQSLIRRTDNSECGKGSAEEINHVAWRTMRSNVVAGEVANNWLREMSVDIQAIVFTTEPFNSRCERRRINRRLLEMLERRSSLDALACLTILLREAHEQGNQELAHKIGHSLFCVLLIVSTTPQVAAIAEELFDLYCERIFPLASWNGFRYAVEDIDFYDMTLYLRALVESVERCTGKGDNAWPNRVQVMCKLMAGKYGFDVRFAFLPPLGPDGPSTEAVESICRVRQRLRKWGVETMASGNSDRFPPAELFRD